MSIETKLNTIKEIVINEYKQSEDIDLCMEKCVGLEGIRIMDIPMLVKKVLVLEKLIVPVKEKRKKLVEYLESECVECDTHEDFVRFCEDMEIEFDLSPQIVKSEIIKIYKKNEWSVPTPNKLRGFKLDVVNCFRENPECTQKELEECLMTKMDDREKAQHYSKYFHEMCHQIIQIMK